jgi:hypothetical protein
MHSRHRGKARRMFRRYPNYHKERVDLLCLTTKKSTYASFQLFLVRASPYLPAWGSNFQMSPVTVVVTASQPLRNCSSRSLSWVSTLTSISGNESHDVGDDETKRAPCDPECIGRRCLVI